MRISLQNKKQREEKEKYKMLKPRQENKKLTKQIIILARIC